MLDELNRIDPEVALIAEVCLATGTRWSEAQNLQARQIKCGLIHLTETKTKLNRCVKIPEELENQLKKKASVGRIFRKQRCEKIFERAVKAVGIELPKGQLTHILRHTFVTQSLMNGMNIYEIQQILGHSSIKTTERYLNIASAQMAQPDKLNPLTMARKRNQLTKKPDLKLV